MVKRENKKYRRPLSGKNLTVDGIIVHLMCTHLSNCTSQAQWCWIVNEVSWTGLTSKPFSRGFVTFLLFSLAKWAFPFPSSPLISFSVPVPGHRRPSLSLLKSKAQKKRDSPLTSTISTHATETARDPRGLKGQPTKKYENARGTRIRYFSSV